MRENVSKIGPAGSRASFVCAGLTVAAIVVGAMIAIRLGAASGMDIAASSAEELRSARPLLAAAEALKIATALAFFLVVQATGIICGTSRLGRLLRAAGQPSPQHGFLL